MIVILATSGWGVVLNERAQARGSKEIRVENIVRLQRRLDGFEEIDGCAMTAIRE